MRRRVAEKCRRNECGCIVCSVVAGKSRSRDSPMLRRQWDEENYRRRMEIVRAITTDARPHYGAVASEPGEMRGIDPPVLTLGEGDNPPHFSGKLHVKITLHGRC